MGDVLKDNLLVQLNATGLQQEDQKLYQFLKRLLDGTMLLAQAVAIVNASSGDSVVNNTIIQQFLSPFGSDSGEDGLPGPPGVSGSAGSTGAAGRDAVGFPGFDGLDGEDGISVLGLPGATGSTGATGATGPVGPAIFLSAEDGQDGNDAIPGLQGQQGSTGNQGPVGPAVFLVGLGEDGQDGFVPGPQGIPGSAGGGAYTQIAQVITTGSQTTVDFSSIPAAYNELRVTWVAQDTINSSVTQVLRLMINADATAADYNSTQQGGGSNTASLTTQIAASVKGVKVGGMSGSAVGTTSHGSIGELSLVGYKNTTFFKVIMAQGAILSNTTGIQALVFTSRWLSTSAINQLTFGTDGTAFLDGSVFTLYGIGS